MEDHRGHKSAAVDSGTPKGLDALYRHYSSWLARILRRQLGAQAHAAEDLVQETYLRVARYVDDGSACHPRALLKQIAVNLARDHMRRHVIHGGLSSPQDIARGVARLANEYVPADQEHDLLLREIVMGLPLTYRDVFVLSRFTGLTYEEIAQHLGIAVKTVEWRMGKALAYCAVRLKD